MDAAWDGHRVVFEADITKFWHSSRRGHFAVARERVPEPARPELANTTSQFGASRALRRFSGDHVPLAFPSTAGHGCLGCPETLPAPRTCAENSASSNYAPDQVRPSTPDIGAIIGFHIGVWPDGVEVDVGDPTIMKPTPAITAALRPPSCTVKSSLSNERSLAASWGVGRARLRWISYRAMW